MRLVSTYVTCVLDNSWIHKDCNKTTTTKYKSRVIKAFLKDDKV